MRVLRPEEWGLEVTRCARSDVGARGAAHVHGDSPGPEQAASLGIRWRTRRTRRWEQRVFRELFTLEHLS